MSELLDRIRSRGYWMAIIRPATFIEKRVAHRSELLPILTKNAVEIKGWSFPHIDEFLNIEKGPDWIGQELAWDKILEFWRFYQSGQFIHYFGMWQDWVTNSNQQLSTPDKAGRVMLDVGDMVLRFTEIFEFAARLAFAEEWDEGVHVEVTVDNLDNHALQLPGREHGKFYWMPEAIDPRLQYSTDLSQTELIATAQEASLAPALRLFKCFRWEPSIDLIRDLQGERLRRKSPVA